MPGTTDGLTYSGLSGCSIHLRDCDTRPGAGTGMDRDGVIQPAFPQEAPLPNSPLSTTTTSR